MFSNFYRLKFNNFSDDNVSPYKMADSTKPFVWDDFTIDRVIEKFKEDGTGNLCIDGMSCSGKSTLLENMKPAPTFKINQVLDCEDYNYNSVTAFQYLMKQSLIYRKRQGYLFDRSMISNLTFQLVYYLMNFDDDTFDLISPITICKTYSEMHGLDRVFEYIKAQKHNILIVINSNLDYVMQRMTKRGSVGDSYKGRVPKYLECQMYAYMYVAAILDYPVYDHGKYPEEERFSRLATIVNRIYDAIKPKMIKSYNDEYSEIENLPSTRIAERWLDRCEGMIMNKR